MQQKIATHNSKFLKKTEIYSIINGALGLLKASLILVQSITTNPHPLRKLTIL